MAKEKRNYTLIFKRPFARFRRLSSNNKLMIILSVIIVLVSVIAFVFTRSPSDQLAEVPSNNFETQIATLTPLNATITRIEGTVDYKTINGDWSEATEATELASEDEIRTQGAASRAIISYEDGSELRLDGDSEVRLDSANEEKIASTLLSGKMYSRVNSTEKPFTVDSEDAKYEAKGTVFIVLATGDLQALEVIESNVLETATNNTISQGNRLIVRDSTDPSNDGKVERMNINDYKEDPFVAWNLEIDKANEIFKDKLGFLQDTDPPKITITSPSQGEVILTEATSNSGAVTISGEAPRANSIKITAKSAQGAPVVDVSVGSGGKFTSSPITSPVGLAVFEIEARDAAGNTSMESLRVTIQRKSAPAVESANVSLFDIQSINYDNTNDKFTLNWFMGEGIDAKKVRILYANQASVTYSSADGIITPATSGNTPGASSYTFKVDSFSSNETYYFRMCEINASNSTCDRYSNTVNINID